MNKNDLSRGARDLIVLVILATVLGLLTTPRNPLFTGFSFHPYHLVLILMAAQYGHVVGMVSAILLIGLYAAGGRFYLDRPGVPMLLEAPHSIFAAGSILIAAITGTLFDQVRSRLGEVDARCNELGGQVKTLQSNAQALETANRDLKARILEETTTFQTMYEMAEKLSTLEPLYLYPAVLEILTQHLGVTRCSFYLVEDDYLRLAAQLGWDSVPESERRVPVDQGVMALVIRDKKPITLKDLLYKDQLAQGEKIMAAPVKIHGSGQVVGVIAVEAIPFERFNAQTVRAFCVVAEWASKAMANVEVLSQKERENKELDIRAKAEEVEREWMLGRIVKQVEVKEFGESVVEQIAALGEAALPRLEEILLRADTKLVTRRNALTVLEKMIEHGHRLSQETYRTFSLECLREWFSYEQYRRLAASAEARAAGEAMVGYLEELQAQLKSCTLRSLVLRLGRGAVATMNVLDSIRAELPKSDPLVHELLDTMESGDPGRVDSVARNRWKMESKSLEQVAGELLGHPDPMMRTVALHTVGLAGFLTARAQMTTLLQDENWLVRETAVQGLVRLHAIQPDPELRKLLAQRATADRDAAVREIAREWVSRWYPELLGGATVHG